MTNTNCLENIVCPRCGHTDSFIIELKTRADVTDAGAETFGEMQWDEWSLIQCKNCDTDGTVAEFTREPPENKKSSRPYSVLLLYPDTGDDPETYYTHTRGGKPPCGHCQRQGGSRRRQPGEYFGGGFSAADRLARAHRGGAFLPRFCALVYSTLSFAEGAGLSRDRRQSSAAGRPNVRAVRPVRTSRPAVTASCGIQSSR